MIDLFSEPYGCSTLSDHVLHLDGIEHSGLSSVDDHLPLLKQIDLHLLLLGYVVRQHVVLALDFVGFRLLGLHLIDKHQLLVALAQEHQRIFDPKNCEF